MDALFASGRIIDLILAGVAAEALLLAWWLRGRGPGFYALMANLASGAALMLALRAALTGASWPTVAGWMLAGLAGHAADFTLRLRRARRYAASGGRPALERAPARGVPASSGLEQL